MLNIILIGVAVIILVFIGLVAVQKPEFKITRSARMAAPPGVVFGQVNDLHSWEAWSPWAKMDPNSQNAYSGSAAGPGASFGWSGNRQVGQGRMTITDSRPNELVRLRLDFEKPMKGTNIAEFTFKPDGPQTVVTWTMTGKNGFVGKVFHLVVNCDKMIGGQFETGLAGIKALAENAGAK